MRHQEQIKIIAARKGQKRAVRNIAIGLGDTEPKAVQALIASSKAFAEGSHVDTLTQRVQQALEAASPDCLEIRIEDPDWDILVKF